MNKHCQSRKKVAVDYVNYYPARGGHAIHIDLIYETFEPEEVDAGSTLGAAICAQCGQWISVILANDIEHGGDTTPYVPQDAERWRKMNGLG